MQFVKCSFKGFIVIILNTPTLHLYEACIRGYDRPKHRLTPCCHQKDVFVCVSGKEQVGIHYTHMVSSTCGKGCQCKQLKSLPTGLHRPVLTFSSFNMWAARHASLHNLAHCCKCYLSVLCTAALSGNSLMKGNLLKAHPASCTSSCPHGKVKTTGGWC